MLPPVDTHTELPRLARIYNGLQDVLRHPGLHHDTFFLVVSTAVGGVGGLIYWKIVTLRYPPATVGLVAAAISIATFLGNFGTLGLAAGVIRFLPGQNRAKKAALIRFAQRVVLAIGTLVTLVFLGGRYWWAHDLLPNDYPELYMFTFLIFAVGVGQMSLIGGILQAERVTPYLLVLYLVFNMVQILGGWLMPLSLGAAGLLLSYMLAIVVVSLGFIFFLPVLMNTINLDHTAPAEFSRLDFLRYSLGLHLFNQMAAIAVLIFPLIVLENLGAEANAGLSITWYAYSFLSIIPSSAAAALFVDGSHAPEALGRRLIDALVFSLSLISPLLLVTIILAPWLLGLFGPIYANAAGLLRILALSIVPSTINNLYFIVRRVRKQIVSLNFLSLLLSVVSIAPGYFLVTRVGLSGIGWGWLGGQSLFALVLIPFILREARRAGAAKAI